MDDKENPGLILFDVPAGGEIRFNVGGSTKLRLTKDGIQRNKQLYKLK